MYKYSMYTGTQVHVVLVEHSSHENANTLEKNNITCNWFSSVTL